MTIVKAKKLIKVEQLEFSNDIEILTTNRYTRIQFSDDTYMWYTGWKDFSNLTFKVYGEEIDTLETGYANAGLKNY